MTTSTSIILSKGEDFRSTANMLRGFESRLLHLIFFFYTCCALIFRLILQQIHKIRVHSLLMCISTILYSDHTWFHIVQKQDRETYAYIAYPFCVFGVVVHLLSQQFAFFLQRTCTYFVLFERVHYTRLPLFKTFCLTVHPFCGGRLYVL